MIDKTEFVDDEPCFSGWHDSTVDDKGRLLIKKDKRDLLGDNFVLALSEIGVVAAYPKATWASMIAEIKAVPQLNLGRQQYGRLVVGTAFTNMNFDAQGRVVIPGALRDSGNIVDKVKVVGNVEKVEIWAEAEYELYQADPDNYGSARLASITKAMDLMHGK